MAWASRGRRRPGLAVSAIAVALTGCSIDGASLLHRPTYLQTADGSARVVRFDTPGLTLLTHVDDAGLILGHAARTYVFAAGDTSPDAPARLCTCEGPTRLDPVEPFDWRTLTPLAIIARDTGVAFHANPLRLGATVGASTRHVLRAPMNHSGTLTLIVNHGRIQQLCIHHGDH